MPKQKTHSGAKKRFRANATGMFKRGKTGKSHILTKKTTKRKRGLRQGTYVDKTREKEIKRLLPYS
jgi:large subunit ribosomal protein L35